MKKHELIEKVLLGGPGSGHHGHKGSPGIGGSLPRGGIPSSFTAFLVDKKKEWAKSSGDTSVERSVRNAYDSILKKSNTGISIDELVAYIDTEIDGFSNLANRWSKEQRSDDAFEARTVSFAYRDMKKALSSQ